MYLKINVHNIQYIYLYLCMSTYTYIDITFKVMFCFNQFSECWDYMANLATEFVHN